MTCNLKPSTSCARNYFCPDFENNSILSYCLETMIDSLKETKLFKEYTVITNRPVKINSGRTVRTTNGARAAGECIIIVNPTSVSTGEGIYNLYTANAPPPNIRVTTLPVKRPTAMDLPEFKHSFAGFRDEYNKLCKSYYAYVQNVLANDKHYNAATVRSESGKLNTNEEHYTRAWGYMKILTNTNASLLGLPGGISPSDNFDGSLLMACHEDSRYSICNKNLVLRIRPGDLQLHLPKSNYYSTMFTG